MNGSAFEFAFAIDQEIESLSREAIIRHNGRAKRLLEELYPLSRFALHMVSPGNHVQIEAFENSGPIDGAIWFGNNDKHKHWIEVTYIRSPEDALRDELLWKTGSAPGRGHILRDKGQIIAVNAVPSRGEIGKLAAKIMENYSKKCLKKYAKGTILLIAFDDPTIFGQSTWRQLFTEIVKRGGLSGGGFADVHIFNCGTNDLLTNIW